MPRYEVKVITTLRKSFFVDALDPEEAKNIVENDCLDDALDTDDFDTEYSVYKM